MCTLSGPGRDRGHRRHRVLQGVRPLGAPALRRGGACAPWPTAGWRVADVDGLTTFTMDTSSEIAVARELGMPELRFFSRINYGGGAACATVQQAAMAVATGVADVVVCYRGFNERSESPVRPVLAGRGHPGEHQRPRQRVDLPDGPRHAGGDRGDAGAPLHARVRRHLGGLRRGRRRRPAARRDEPQRRSSTSKPITLEDHQASRMIVDPLHLLDCCQESDGAVALVVTSAERARDLRQTPAVVAAAAQGSGRGPVRHDVVLPRRHRHPGDGRGRPRAVAPVEAGSRRHADGDPLRPLHAVRPDAAGGARLLRPRRGDATSSPTARSRSAAGCRSTPTAASSARPTSTA